MAAKKTTEDKRIAELEAEVERLQKRIDKTQPKITKKRFSWRTVGVVVAIGLAGALLIVGNIVFWTGRTLTDTQRYTEVTQSLIEDSAIQDAIANKATNAIFSQVDIEQIAQNALPPRAQFLAPSIATQAESFTNQQLKKAVASSEFQNVWLKVNTDAHQRLINFIKNYQGDGTFNINDLYAKLSDKLKDTKLSFLANKPLPSSVGQIKIISAPNLPKAHWIVVNLVWIRFLTFILFIALTILGIWLSDNRRKAVIRITSLYAGLLFASMIAFRITRTIFVDRVTPEYQAAALSAWTIILHSLLLQTVALIAIFVTVAVTAWVTGSGKRATVMRSRFNMLFSGKLHEALFKGKENKFTVWIAQNKVGLEIFVLILAGLSLMIVRLTPQNVAIIALVSLVLVFLVNVLTGNKKR